MKIAIPSWMSEEATRMFKACVPRNGRTKGHPESPGQIRGEGDLLDYLGKKVVWGLLIGRGKSGVFNHTVGRGDDFDLKVWVGGAPKTINVKTSKFGPCEDVNLRLFVKEEDAQKPTDFFVQVFVHLNEEGEAPHAHVAGFLDTTTEVWRRGLARGLEPIPSTDGGMAYQFWTEDDLSPIPALIETADDRP